MLAALLRVLLFNLRYTALLLRMGQEISLFQGVKNGFLQVKQEFRVLQLHQIRNWFSYIDVLFRLQQGRPPLPYSIAAPQNSCLA